MKVKELLKDLKANKTTYYNLDKQTVNDFKKLYSYLKKHKEKDVYTICMDEFNKQLNNVNFIDYLKKYRAMRILSTNINHYPF